jgi:hypothetical protein
VFWWLGLTALVHQVVGSNKIKKFFNQKTFVLLKKYEIKMKHVNCGKNTTVKS